MTSFPVCCGFGQKLDEEDFKEEQNSVARLIHMLYNDEPEEMLKVINLLEKFFFRKLLLSNFLGICTRSP